MYFDPNINDDGERTSSSMLETFMTTMNYGMRNGGGIGDTLIPQSFRTENRTRFLFILYYVDLWFILVTILYTNIIFGIIIDTFGGWSFHKKLIIKARRDEASEVAEDK